MDSPIKKFNHIGISVVDLERSLDFYCRLLGMDLVTLTSFSGTDYADLLGLPGAQGQVALLKTDALQIELFQFFNPEPKTRDHRQLVSDHGISHFCFQVQDLERCYTHLAAASVNFHNPPIEFSGGRKAVYARDPDGNVIELCELP